MKFEAFENVIVFLSCLYGKKKHHKRRENFITFPDREKKVENITESRVFNSGEI